MYKLEDVNAKTDVEGLFVYRARRALYVRRLPAITDDSRTPKAVNKNELVAVDKCLANKDPQSNDGPFLRLTCGGGWLFEYKRGEQEMFQVRVKDGLWAYTVDNQGVGLSLRQHPSHRSDLRFEPERRFHDGCVVWADKKLIHEGVTFLRIQGTDGWLFDKRDDVHTLVRVDKRILEKEGCTPFILTVKQYLSVDEVRALATDHGYIEVHHDEAVQAVGFVKENATPTGEKASTPVVRIDIYYGTGTVRTVLHHPYHHASEDTTNLYKMDCTLTELWDIMANPYTTDKWHYKGWKLEEGKPDTTESKKKETTGKEALLSEETMLRKACCDLDDKIKFFCEQRDGVLAGIRAIESKREDYMQRRYDSAQERERARAEQAEKDHAENMRKRRGDNATIFCNHADVVTENFEPSVVYMAMAGTSTLLLYENGNWSYTAGLPSPLHKRLYKRSVSDPLPKVVAIGPHHRYFVEFADGKTYWEGLSKQFDEAAKSTNNIAKVAFGALETSFFLLEANGATQYCDLPDALTDHLKTSYKKVHHLSLGPAGEWYVSWKDGSWRCDNISTHMTEKINKLQKKGWHIRDMAFGEGATYVIRYGMVGGKYLQD
uniref:Uncharacterized protein n=1 Tax=Pyramimonas obovata TaxID=1411642 RepID=A0A7S0REJ4_9CHLO|mmetsp:Transcript_32262/g.70387  ORF Transcript_32262/g.70387 Transcript_32262/m.70387 type:complete len:603 (+) Transcript_32262:194-2002(+)